jgi:hypothetical protein
MMHTILLQKAVEEKQATITTRERHGIKKGRKDFMQKKKEIQQEKLVNRVAHRKRGMIHTKPLAKI